MSRVAPIAFAALVSICVVAGTGLAEDPEPEVSSYAPFLPGTEPENVAVVRILTVEDGRTVPLKGARVTGWSEESDAASALAARVLAEGISDEHGFVNLTWPPDGEVPFHWIADAPGKAVRTFSPASLGGVFSTDRDVYMTKGAPFAVRILSPIGEPLVGAYAEYYIYGCPHSPAVRKGITDDDGCFVLDGMPDPADVNHGAHNDWGQFWIVGAGAETRRYYAPARRTDGAASVILTDVGRSVSGVVEGEDGEPRPGVVVRRHGYPRGPVNVTDAEGRFHLSGLGITDGIAFYDPGDLLEGRPNALVGDFEPDVPIRLTLRTGRSSALGQGEPHEHAEVEVLQRWPAMEPSHARGVPVRLVRLSDGLVIAGETGSPSHGLFSELAPPGRYRITVGGGFSEVVEGRQEVDLPRKDPVRFVLDQTPTLLLRGVDPHEPEWVGLRLPFGMETATDRGGHALHLPPETPAVIQVARDGPVLVPVGPVRDGFRMVTVPDPTPVRVHLRVRSSDPDRPLEDVEIHWADDESYGDEGDVDEDGRWTFETWRRGARKLTLWQSGFEETTVDVHLKAEDREVDLDTFVVHPLREHRFQVLHHDGTVPEDMSIYWGVRGEQGNELPETDGTFVLELGPTPQPAVLRGEGLYPVRMRLSSTSPAELRLPGGRLDVRVKDEQGRPLKSVVYVDHVNVFGRGGEHALRGVPAGPHTVIVGAEGHVGAVLETEIAEGESCKVELKLARR